jgi:hypothetical protein
MQLIFGHDNAEQLREQHTILELESVTKDGVTLDVYCLVPADKINLVELPQLEHNRKLHQAFVDAYKSQDFKICRDLHEHLLGKFGGEVDSFYTEIINRIK